MQTPFVENRGQYPDEVSHVSKANGLTVGTMADGLLLDYSQPSPKLTFLNKRGTPEVSTAIGHRVRLVLENEGRTYPAVGGHQTDTIYNFFVGPEGQHRSHVPSFASVTRQISDSAGYRVYAAKDGMRYDLWLSPGRSTRSITVRYDGVTNLRVDPSGAVAYQTSIGLHREHGRFAYQGQDRRPLPLQVTILDGNRVRYTVSESDPREYVLIDPIYAGAGSFLNLDRTTVTDVAAAANGDVFVAGSTESATAIPVTPGSYQTALSGTQDAILMRFDPHLLRTKAVTYFGGIRGEAQTRLALTPTGGIYVAGTTNSDDLPTTGGFISDNSGGGTDAYVVRMRSDLGAVSHGTYLGGNALTAVYEMDDVTVNEQGFVGVSFRSNDPTIETYLSAPAPFNEINEVNVCYVTLSTDLRRTGVYGSTGSAQPDRFSQIEFVSEGGLVLAFRTADQGLSARFGLPSLITAGPFGDAYVLRVRRNGVPIGGTYLGSQLGGSVTRLAVSTSGSVYVGGFTLWPLSLTLPGWQATAEFTVSGYVVRLRSDLSGLLGGTYTQDLAGEDYVTGLELLPDGTVVTSTVGTGVTPKGSGSQSAHGGNDLSVLRFRGDLTDLLSATNIGGSGNEGAVFASAQKGRFSTFVMAGLSESTDYLMPTGAWSESKTLPVAPLVQQVAFTADLIELAVRRTTLTGGSNTLARITAAAATSTPRTFTLTSSMPSVLAPAVTTITIPAGEIRSELFRLDAFAVTGATPVTITASSPNDSRSQIVTVVP